MTDREERQHVIEVLKSWDGYFIGYTSDEVQEALRYAINSIEIDLKYDLLYEETSGQADKPTTKNDLGVDAVSRKAVHDMLENLPITVENKWFNWLQKACMRLAELPSVTPQEPKTGHWIRISPAEIYECSECGQNIMTSDICAYKFCHGCGAKMIESKESEEA